MRLQLALLLSVLCLFSSTALGSVKLYDGLVNKAVTRSINLKQSFEETEVKIEIENAGSQAADFFLVAVERAEHLSFIQGYDKDGSLLQTEKTLVDGSSGVFYKVDFKNTLKAKATVSVRVVFVYTHVLKPYPAEIKQGEPHLVLFNGNAYFYSPYKTTEQTTKVLLPSDRLESHTTVDPTALTASGLTYGSYSNVKAFSTEAISVHVETTAAFATFAQMRKDIEISMWGNVAVEEHIELANTGANLKGSFSRFDYQRLQGGPISGSFRGITAHLPEAARDLYYRDEIGNISSSHVRKSDEGGVVMEILPRFPLFGGWKTDFYYGYNLPSDQALFVDGKTGLYVLNVTFGAPFADVVVDQLTVRVILPEGASSITVVTPFEIESESRDVHYTYLDITGRTVVVLTKSNLVNHHNQPFQVLFSFSSLSLWKEPLMVAFFFLAFFLLSMGYLRLDLSLGSKSKAD
eukprot:TRINITY_DN659_c0_g2_i1.p1 TRINITY_DN659_c0_g2~~TRINITY_DN659_c0_g2_i1.p1  ORF type:complete len:463 (+),score=165.65 TRINITY_DN659_c0_g2_i1:71-1459(+)